MNVPAFRLPLTPSTAYRRRSCRRSSVTASSISVNHMSNYRIDTRTIVPGLAVTLADGVLSVTIDRPESLNSLTKPVLAGMADAIEGAATDPRVKVVRLGAPVAASAPEGNQR